MSVAEDVVTPRCDQVPNRESATTSAQRSAAQNGQDSSLTKTMAGLPPAVSGAPAATTDGPALARARTPAGTVVAARVTAAGAAASLLAADGDPDVSLTATS